MMKAVLALLLLVSLSACSSYKRAYTGPERPLDEVAVLAGGYKASSGALDPELGVDFLAVREARSGGESWKVRAPDALHLPPSTYEIDVHLSGLLPNSPLGAALTYAFRDHPDETTATLRIPMNAGSTYVVHLDRETLDYFVSAIPTTRPSLKKPGMVPFSNATPCKPPVDGEEHACTLLKAAPREAKDARIEKRKHWPYPEW